MRSCGIFVQNLGIQANIQHIGHNSMELCYIKLGRSLPWLPQKKTPKRS